MEWIHAPRECRVVNRTLLRYVVQYGLGLAVLGWVVWYSSRWQIVSPQGEVVGLATIWQRPIGWTQLAASAALCLAASSLTFVRWFVLVRAQELPFTLRSAFRLGMIGLCLNTFLPGSVGGDLMKAVFLAREQERRTVAVATVVLDRVIGMIGLFCLVLLVGVTLWGLGAMAALETNRSAELVLRAVCGTAALTVGLVAGVWLALRLLPAAWATRCEQLLSRMPRIGASLAELWRAAWMYRSKGGTLLATLVMTLAAHGMQVFAFHCAGAALFEPAELPSLAAQYILIPAGMTMQAAVPTPGGLGGGEAIFGSLYASCGFAFVAGVLSSLCYRIVTWFWGLVGYVVYYRLRTAPAPSQTAEGLAAAEAHGVVIPSAPAPPMSRG
jgi:uncharacterized protein (TIRG00374 family)